MAKGSNSLRNKKLHSSKPYDVSSSFVKKVTSRVTNLLPQPAWLSKWFSSSVDDEVQRRDTFRTNDSGSEDDDTTNVHTPVKRAKIPLNQPFSPNSFKVFPVVNDQVSSQQAGTSRIIQDDIGTDEAVAGPSRINRRQQLVSSTPNIQSTATHLLAGTERKMNGDDRSESSESTSGCSSLVPQANRQFQAGENVMNSLSGRKRSMDEKLNFTGHLQSPRSLFSDRSHSRSPRLNSSVNRRRPSFNVSSFGSPVLGKDKSATKTSIIHSPFYAGRTTYGGASAYRNTKDGFFVHSEKRCGVQVKPVNCVSDSLSSMSTTARRILEALEQFSTPVLDAKRIPVESSTPPLSNKRKHPYDKGLRPGQAPQTPNSASGLTIPTVPDLLKMRHREKLQDSLESARLIAVSSYPSNFNQEYRLRFEDEGKTGRHGGKIRSKEKELEEVTVEAVNLPNISLPVTSLPKFDFVVPPAASTPTVTSTFKFASPITVTENTRTCLPADNFTFSKPLSAIGNTDLMISREMNCVDNFIPNRPTKLSEMQFISGSDSKLMSSEKGDIKMVSCKNNQNSDMCSDNKPATELKADSVTDVLEKEPNSTGKQELKEVSSSSSISFDKFKPATGTWECEVCMIHNRSDATKCAACENSHTAIGSSMSSCPGMQFIASKDMWECSSCHVHNPYSATVCRKCLVSRTGQNTSRAKEPEQPSVSLSGFGNKFKPASDTWECGTCLVRNPDSSKQCQACETKRPVLATKSAPTSSSKSTLGLGFGDRFKKPPGAWDCPDCMVQNNNESLKCVACERAKPGSESHSTVKFNFGIDKAGVPLKEADTASSSSMQGFSFGETKVTTASNFSFGVNQACETKSPVLATKSTPTSSSMSTTDVLFGDRFKKPSGTWNCPDCMVQNSDELLKCVACERAKPGSESHSTVKFNFGIDKAGVPLKEVDTASSSSMQGFRFGETKVTTASESVPGTTKSCTSAVVTTGFNFGNEASPLSTSNTVVKLADTRTLSQTGFSFEVPQPCKSQSPPSVDKPSGGVPKKCQSSDTGEVSVDLKGDGEVDSGLSTEPATLTNTKKIDEKPEGKDLVAKRVTFSFGAPGFTGEKHNISTKTSESVKPSFNFIAPSVGTNATDLNLGSSKLAAVSAPSFSFTSSQATFGSSTTAAAAAATTTTTTTTSTTTTAAAAATATATVGASTAASTAASNVFTFGSTKSCMTFGGSSQESVTTSGSAPVFGTALKTTAAPSTFNFSFHVNNKESVGGTMSNKGAPSFVSVTSTAAVTPFGPLTTTTITSPSLPSFGSATTTPSFSLEARGTIPAFGTPNTTSTNTTVTTSGSFSNVSTPEFSTGFSSLNEQKSAPPAFEKSTSSPAPFTFGSNLGQTTPFSFGSIQNDQGLASKSTFSFGTASTPVTNAGFVFVPSNQATSQVAPTFSFGSSVATTSSTAISRLFGVPAPASGPVFGAAASVFGANNPSSNNPATTTAAVTAATSTPAFNFGSSSSQPSSNVFGFTASPATASASVPVQNFTSPTPNFIFNQTQTTAQPSVQLVAPTFDPSVRPTFNFTKGETPSFTAAATPGPTRRIKKAVRRTHPR